jgi:sigma-B regulation protein RsbU (phosphoserine phosphatase)
MSAAPLPHTSSQPSDAADLLAAGNNTPVFALKELVARLNREQYKVQDLLSSLSFALRSFKNLNQFLELIPMIATRVADADGGALVLFRPNGQVRLEQLFCQDKGDHQCQARSVRQALELATRKVTGALTSGMVKDYRVAFDAVAIDLLDKTVRESLGPTVQVFGASIVVNETERGRLYAFGCEPGFSWTPKRQKLVRLVADQTAVAVDNADMAVELRKKERLDRELEIGAEIQLRLLPRQFPRIQGVDLAARCETADRVGGDYYDFIPVCRNPSLGRNSQTKLGGTETTPWSIAIGDVMGKGVPAGLIMTMTRGMLRAEVLNGHSPARILHHLNRVMYADLENSHRFVTLFYSEYDPKTRILSYSNAAHNPPLLWQARFDNIIPLDTEGMLIGLDANSEFKDAQIQLYPGDAIVFFTDGFTDAANPRGQRFEEDRLRDGFYWACHNCDSAQGILTHLFDRVQEFVGPDNRNADDMTAVVLRITQEPQEPQLPELPRLVRGQGA